MKNKKQTYNSEYLNNERKEYSIYVLETRAIPAITDGLKAGARRLLWTARDGKKYKSATLAGATIPLHPHAPPESALNTLAGPYVNNIPLLDGGGEAFGTRLDPTAYGASRYTSVKLSKFTHDVVFKDIELIEMKDNYDNTLKEPVHFIPLVPVCLVNPSEGVAVGFASILLPRKLDDIIDDQINFLSGKKIKDKIPFLSNFNGQQPEWINEKWMFKGNVELEGRTAHIKDIPYGITHQTYLNTLNKLKEQNIIKSYIDDSQKTVDITVKLTSPEKDVLNKLKLVCNITENMNVLDFDHKKVRSTNYSTIIADFSTWRVSWYYKRYQRLIDIAADDLQRNLDIINACKAGIGNEIQKLKNRQQLIFWLSAHKIVNLDYVANLPSYRFTQEEVDACRQRVKELNAKIVEYTNLINDSNKIKNVYIEELKEIKTNYMKGKYAAVND